MSPVHRISTQIEDIYRVHCPNASGEEIQERAMELLKLVNLPPRVYRLYPHEMSGGMLQRGAIAISLLHHPQLLILPNSMSSPAYMTATLLQVVATTDIYRALPPGETAHDENERGGPSRLLAVCR